MNTKLVATLTILIFTLSTVAIAVPPAAAHFTLGHLTGVSRFRVQDFDPHVPGVVGYVFPGAGSAAWGGAPSSAFPAPGYQSPYPGGNPGGAPSSSWYQLESNAYAPFGAILTSTADHANKGDLIFAINFTCTTQFLTHEAPANGPNQGQGNCPNGDVRFRRWYIYVPPEFGTIVRSQVTSTITNDYNFIRVSTASSLDPFGPGWRVIQIRGEDEWDCSGLGVANAITGACQNGPNGNTGGVGREAGRRGYIAFTKDHGFKDWYYVRVNGVTAPQIAGRYFFKFIMRPTRTAAPSGSAPTVGNLINPTISGASSSAALTYPADFTECNSTPAGIPNQCVPIQNWPVLLVKGEVDPAIIDGIIRYAGTNTTLYGQPLNVAGRVRAVGTAIDPYTGASTGRAVEARGYFNSTAQGHYEIEGVAPGVYTIYAEAAGFPEFPIAQNVKVLSGQSLHFDGLLNPGPVIHGQVFSKHNFGEEAWTRLAPIRIEILDTDKKVVTASPYNMTDGAPGLYDYTGYLNGGARMSYDWIQEVGAHPVPVAFDWENGPAVAPSYYGRTIVDPAIAPVIPAQTFFCGGSPDPCGRHNGVGPAQYWWVDPFGLYTNGGGAGSFIYQFGYKIGGAAVYGAPKDFDGHVPQALATYINGLTAGRYYVRAYVNGYVQTALDGRTFQDYFFDVAKDEWSGDITVPLDLLKSSFIEKTIHFHDIPGSLIENPVSYNRTVWVEVWDVSSDLAEPKLAGWNMTVVTGGTGAVSLNVTGFGLHGFDPRSSACTTAAAVPAGTGILGLDRGNAFGCSGIDGTFFAGPTRISTFGWQGAPYEDYGLPAGTYEVRTYVEGYVQQQFERVTLALSNSPARISDHMWKGAHFNVTVFSTDWERPRVERPWNYPGEDIYVWFVDSKGNAIDYDQYYAQAFDGFSVRNDALTKATEFFCTQFTFTAPSHCPNYFEGSDVWHSSILNDVFADSLALATLSGGGGEPVLPTAFDTDTYTAWGYTYGYVQKKTFSAYAQKGNSTSDIKVNLVQGANITLNLKFKLENVFSGTFANMSMRIRAFNEKGQLAAEWLTSPENEFGGGIRNLPAGTSIPTGGTGNPATSLVASAYALGNGDPRNLVLDYVPAGTTDVQVRLNGVEDALRDPNFAHITAAYNGADGSPASLASDDFPYGIDGYPNYQGAWTIEADTLFWYPSCPTSPPAATCFYPPVIGLLQGESFHTIPGHPNGLYGYTGDALSANHLGPYAQKMVWTVPNAHLGGESSVTFELDQRAFIAGRIDAFTWSGELRPLSFASMTIAGANGFKNTEYTWDGQYEAFLNAGDYNFTIGVWSPSGPGFKTLNAPVHLSDGQTAIGQNFGPLERSNIPIPEFSGLAVVVASALAASLYLLRRRRR